MHALKEMAEAEVILLCVTTSKVVEETLTQRVCSLGKASLVSLILRTAFRRFDRHG